MHNTSQYFLGLSSAELRYYLAIYVIYLAHRKCTQISLWSFFLAFSHLNLKFLQRFIIDFCFCTAAGAQIGATAHMQHGTTQHRVYPHTFGCNSGNTGRQLRVSRVCLNLKCCLGKIIKNATLKNKSLFIWLSCQINHTTRQMPENG